MPAAEHSHMDGPEQGQVFQEAPALSQGSFHNNQPKTYTVSRQAFILHCLAHSEPELLLSACLSLKVRKSKDLVLSLLIKVRSGARVEEETLLSFSSSFKMLELVWLSSYISEKKSSKEQSQKEVPEHIILNESPLFRFY